GAIAVIGHAMTGSLRRGRPQHKDGACPVVSVRPPRVGHINGEKRNMMRILIGALLSVFCSSALATTGVAFVHGTGHQTNALDDYWTADMVNSVRQGLPNPNNYLVVNCDFTQYMWTSAAAGCLADQLYTFIQNRNIDDLVVITHSNGGNVMRWILSNPTWDRDRKSVV